jgi:hypothetical protein
VQNAGEWGRTARTIDGVSYEGRAQVSNEGRAPVSKGVGKARAIPSTREAKSRGDMQMICTRHLQPTRYGGGGAPQRQRRPTAVNGGGKTLNRTGGGRGSTSVDLFSAIREASCM